MYLLLAVSFISIIGILIYLIKDNVNNKNLQQERDYAIKNQQLTRQYNEQIQSYNQQLEQYKTEQEKKLNEWLADYQNTQKVLIDKQLVDYKKQVQETYTLNDEKQAQLLAQQIQVYNEGLADFNTRAQEEKDEVQGYIDDLWTKWSEVRLQLNDYQAKRDAINNEIMRQRELEEQEDFFKIVLPQEVVSDIAIFNEIRPRLFKAQLLDKMIYDTYIAKPTNEMIKRVLKGEAPSGIYKITRLKTGEVYIGKSTNVKERWQQHVKSAFHCGTISHSTLHTTMERDGIQNFTFELLEEVEKENLTEREKFYITFYDSAKYGMNERVG